MLRTIGAATLALLATHGAAQAASISLIGRAAGGGQFSVDAYTPNPAIFFLIDPALNPSVSISLLRDVLDIDGNLLDHDTSASATAGGYALANNTLSALMDVTFDGDNAFTDQISVTVDFAEQVNDIFAINDQDVIISVADAASPPGVVPLPAPVALLATGLFALAALRRRA